MKIIKLPLTNYGEALRMQLELVKKVQEQTLSSALMFLQHPPTYTAGRRMKGDEDSGEKFASIGAEFHKVARGGQMTFHGPGQLVAYPILNIKKIGVRDYVCKLESTLIDTCKEFGINAHRTKDTGVWVKERKIASLGVQVSRYVSFHGIALNCNVDLKWFDHIIPCGLAGKKMTSISDQSKKQVTVENVTPYFVNAFCQHFNEKPTF